MAKVSHGPLNAIESSLQQARIRTGFARCQFNLHNPATHLLDALLLFKPIVIGHQLRKEGVLQFPLGTNSRLAGNASRDLKHSHGAVSPNSNQVAN
jgi:hypothetical protein